MLGTRKILERVTHDRRAEFKREEAGADSAGKRTAGWDSGERWDGVYADKVARLVGATTRWVRGANMLSGAF